MKMYINLGETKSAIARKIERIVQNKLANVQALEVEYCFIAKKETIHITNIITGKNKPSVALALTQLKKP